MITYDLLKEALQLLGTEEAKQAIAEIDELQQLDTDKDIWHNECFIVSAFTADELMVETTYDVYDKLYKASKDRSVSFDEYSTAVRKLTLGPSGITTSMMQLGYDIIVDLHQNNLKSEDDDQQPVTTRSIPVDYVNAAAQLLNRFWDICSDDLDDDERSFLKETFDYYHVKHVDQQPVADGKMSEAEMHEFLVDNIDRISPSDAYYRQYQQAYKIRHAMMIDANNESPSAATNQAIFTIGNKALNIGCFNAEAVGAFDDALLEIMQNAVEQIYIG